MKTPMELNSRQGAVFWSIWFSTFLAFRSLIGRSNVQADSGTFVHCWPHFPSCEKASFLFADTNPYLSGGIFALFFVLIAATAVLAWEKRWSSAISFLQILFLAKTSIVYFLTARSISNFEHFLTLMSFLFLFHGQNLRRMELGMVLFYVLSGFVKLSPAWILGGYFRSLADSMIFLPPWMVVILCNFVIFLELVLSWLLLSEDRYRRHPVVAIFVAFHLFSTIWVGFVYPTYCMPILLALFYRPEERTHFKTEQLATKFRVGMAIFAGVQIALILFNHQMAFTGESLKYGLYMFDRNYQCMSKATVHFSNAPPREFFFHSANAQDRCGLWEGFLSIREKCQAPGVERVEWQFDRSENGSPFYRVVAENNACALDYKIGRNLWARGPLDGAPVVAFPLRNFSEPGSPHAYPFINPAFLFQGPREAWERDQGMPEVVAPGRAYMIVRLAWLFIGVLLLFRFILWPVYSKAKDPSQEMELVR